MSENTVVDSYQILVVNIKYGKEINTKVKNRPIMTILDVPEHITRSMKNEEKFRDKLETFAYDTITKKYGAEVNYCQVWMPLEETK